MRPVVAAEGDWRERVERTLGLGPSNQAAILPPRGNLLRADRLSFASQPELRVYETLRAGRGRDLINSRRDAVTTDSVVGGVGHNVCLHDGGADMLRSCASSS